MKVSHFFYFLSQLSLFFFKWYLFKNSERRYVLRHIFNVHKFFNMNILKFVIGNLSHPSVNRWGLNLFWYNLWYTDKNYSFWLHQDKLFTTFFSTYINYGLLYPTNFLTHKYWYNDEKKEPKNSYNQSHNLKYFRIAKYKDPLTKIYEEYTARSNVQHIYVTKIWLLRYGSWFILNFYCFRPREVSLIARIKVSNFKKTPTSISFVDNQSYKIFKRIKFILTYYQMQQQRTPGNFYNF